ncbi:non-classical arabinogalactan protein 30-like [Actinidia eriantha]|uniref:non-classical arabinogalactan protein 30-like n=1 Tax=Actinidia eriantha TaxID=165200 RepID=UPI0025850F11|nr:non-classical arabinogalactan protein 30-like [Actinidia eriantha]
MHLRLIKLVFVSVYELFGSMDTLSLSAEEHKEKPLCSDFKNNIARIVCSRPEYDSPQFHDFRSNPKGAVVKLQCNNSKYPVVEGAKTDENGSFLTLARRISPFRSHKCKVFLVSSPAPTCNKPTNLHYGKVGAILWPQKQPRVLHFYEFFTVGPFAFEHSKFKCPH